MMAVRGWEEGDEELLFHRYEVLVGEDAKNSGNG